MVKDFTKEDIPVLGRLVSISDDNTVANAEQIWDAKQETNQSEINQSVENRLLTIENTSGLTPEYKNILDYLLLSTNLAEYNTGDWNAEPELFYYPVTFKNHAVFDHGQVEVGKGNLTVNDPDGQWYSLVVDGNFPNTDNKAIISYGRNSISGSLDIEGDEGSQALYVSRGNARFNNDLHTDGNLTVAGDIKSVTGDSFFNGDINAQSDLNVEGTVNINSLDSILLSDSDGLTLNQIIDGVNEVEVWELNVDLTTNIVDFGQHTKQECQDIIKSGKTINVLIYANDLPVPIYNLYSIIQFGGIYFVQCCVNPFDSNSVAVTYIAAGMIGENGLIGQCEVKSVQTLTSKNLLRSITIYDPLYKSEWESGCGIGLRYDSSVFTTIANPKTLTLKEEYVNLPTQKQDTLISGENIKTINGESLLGSGNISITGGEGTGNVVDNNYVHTDNNYTTAEKEKLANIPADAEANIQSNWNETDTSSDAYILNKPTALSAFTNDMQFVTMGDISTAGAITATDIRNWNNKADASTSLSGYGIKFDHNYFEDDETDGLTFTAQYITDHPVKMTQAQGASEWSTAGDNKVPTVGAVYNKFLANDDSTVVKTTGNQTISGTKTFSAAPIVSGIKASGDNQSGIKLFTTNGSISALKTINGNSLFGTGNISTTYSNFTSPTNNAAGVAGLVPAPAAGTQNYILGATGWVNPSLLVEDDVTVIITPTDANIRMIMTLAANMTETLYNAAYSLNTSGFTFTINGQQYSYNEISQMKRSKFKFEFSSDFAYNTSTQNGFTITSHKFIPYDHSDMLVIYAIRDDDEAFVFGFASSTFMFGALGPDLQYNKLKIKYNASDNNNRLFSVLSQFYQVFGMKSDIIDLVSHKLIYDATPVTADLQYAGDNIAFYGLIGSTDMSDDGTGLSFSARPEYGLVEYRNGVLVV